MLFFPDKEKEPAADKPKREPYVHFVKKFRNYQGKADESNNYQEYKEVEEDYYMKIEHCPNVEAIENIRIHEGARVIGFGNFPEDLTIPANRAYVAIARHLRKNTELQFIDKDNPIYKEIEAKVRADIASESPNKPSVSEPSENDPAKIEDNSKSNAVPMSKAEKAALKAAKEAEEAAARAAADSNQSSGSGNETNN